MVQTRSLIIYGPHLYPTKLSNLLQDLKPISSSTVVVPSAFLSFIPGIPFVEPCYANCIVQGYNDEGEWRLSTGKEKGKEVGDVKGNEDYRRWIWERCSPGTEYEGNLPHPLEGMVYELDLESFDLLLQRLLSASPSAPYSLLPVDYIPYTNGDSDNPTSSPKQAEILVFSSSLNITQLQPTQEYLALILRGAFFTPFTRTYLSHLFLIQPYAPKSIAKRIMRRLIQLTMVPQFLVFWVPSRIKGFGWWYDRVGKRLGGWGVGVGIERLTSRWVGSGWRND